MEPVGKSNRAPFQNAPKTAAVFGASGGIGAALANALAQGGCETIYAGSRSGNPAIIPPVKTTAKTNAKTPAIHPFRFDLTDETSIADAAQIMRDNPPELIIVATGILTLPDGSGPERTYKRLDAQTMADVLALNTIGPAMIAKHMLPLLPRGSRGVFAALSARVGSISDNGLGGWHSYRASKAALNMLIKNFALEMGRTHKHAVIAGLHPGTVDSALSEPFQSNLPGGQLTQPADAAANLLSVLGDLTPDDSGNVFDFAGKRVPA